MKWDNKIYTLKLGDLGSCSPVTYFQPRKAISNSLFSRTNSGISDNFNQKYIESDNVDIGVKNKLSTQLTIGFLVKLANAFKDKPANANSSIIVEGKTVSFNGKDAIIIKP